MADHSHGDAHGHHATDQKAAFTGLIVGAALVGAILYGVVLTTNVKFSHEKGAEAHAAATK